jgi:hypothetical protein
MALSLKTLVLCLVLSGTSGPASALSCAWPDTYAPTGEVTEQDFGRQFTQGLADWLSPLRHEEVVVHGVFTSVQGDKPFQHQLEHDERRKRTMGTYPPENEVEAQVDYRYFGKVRFQGVWLDDGELVPVDTDCTVMTLSLVEGIMGRLPPFGTPVVGKMRRTSGHWEFHTRLGPCPAFVELSADELEHLLACRNDRDAC